MTKKNKARKRHHEIKRDCERTKDVVMLARSSFYMSAFYFRAIFIAIPVESEKIEMNGSNRAAERNGEIWVRNKRKQTKFGNFKCSNSYESDLLKCVYLKGNNKRVCLPICTQAAVPTNNAQPCISPKSSKNKILQRTKIHIIAPNLFDIVYKMTTFI